MVTYLEFNKTILEYYLARASSSFFTLSIDAAELEKVINLDSIKKYECLRYGWEKLLVNENDIPQYFGLLAIQCLAASMMENDKLSSAEAYQIRLRQLLKLYDDSCLQNLFKGIDPAKRIQEEIWYQAKYYLKSEHNLDLDIPTKTTHAGRYVQYPKSQALLNSEDLKYFTSFFAQEFEVKEDIPLQHFKVRLEACFHNLNTTNHTLKLWEDYDKKEQCIRQLFSYYNQWEGEVYVEHRTNKTAKTFTEVQQKAANRNAKRSIILTFDENEPKFYTIKYNELNKEETTVVSLAEVEKYKLVNNEFLIFNKSDYYENEFDNSRFLYSDTCSYILINKRVTSQSIYRYFERNNSKVIMLTDTLILYQFDLTEEGPIALIKYMQNVKPVRLIGGLKINRRNDYLIGYGPSILSDYHTIVLFENRKVEYAPQIQRAGCYTVRVDYCKDVNFEIIEDVDTSQLVSQNEYGWNLTTISIDSYFDLQGLNLRHEQNTENIIRSWISINNQKKKVKGNNTSNILINALNNCFNHDC